MPIDRRTFLASLAAVAPALTLARPAAAQTESVLTFLAQAELLRLGNRIPNQDVVGVVNFARPSSEPRMHLIDMRTGAIQNFLVAHGRGSDPEHSGWLQTFSNEFNSECSSKGAFLTGNYYYGHHGHSMRLIGLDATNSNAEAREIVVHSAAYVCPEILREKGVLGLSEGCFAVDVAALPSVIDRLGPGRLLVSTKI
ncbi:MAG TPA: murein L,D-transpeptidase catalytic domain family protein [Caulobacteraceae bacterium]|nr:murein L,D-transpeptidase catalytic domain family protein [Caulobacteraceae bacterium]